jgi:hypothetical protein
MVLAVTTTVFKEYKEFLVLLTHIEVDKLLLHQNVD